MRILVVGAGAVGGYFGGRLAQAGPGCHVSGSCEARQKRSIQRDFKSSARTGI